MRRLATLLCAAALAAPAFAQTPSGGTRVEFASLDDKLAAEPIFGYLYLPREAAPGRPAPAVVLVHGSGGVRDAREGDYGRALSEAGIAVLAIDSFTPRGIASTVDDQTRLSLGQMVRDAFAAAAFLRQQPAIDPARIAVMGMSRGGAVAMRAADSREQAEARARLGVGNFKAYVALYPGCSTQYRNPRVSGPMLVLIGEDDDYTGVKTCAQYIERIRAAGANAELKTYPGAAHGFADGDSSSLRRIHLPSAQNFRDCVFYIEDDGRLVSHAGTPIDPANPRQLMEVARRECLRQGASVGANPQAKARALADIKAFLASHL
ncbi:MAG: dienelactone hydrolase family protein [Burkholderiales bacterium]|nr:dienelactone hydrolase family protein [Burkholderiales bacterium]